MPRYIEKLDCMPFGNYIRSCEVRSAGKPTQVWFLSAVKVQRYQERKFIRGDGLQVHVVNEVVDIIIG